MGFFEYPCGEIGQRVDGIGCRRLGKGYTIYNLGDEI
jgi:hypothetical protein